jgi:hypothetical protein
VGGTQLVFRDVANFSPFLREEGWLSEMGKRIPVRPVISKPNYIKTLLGMQKEIL